MARATWCWRRWIIFDQQELWQERMQSVTGLTWSFTERPPRARILLEAYTEKKSCADSLTRRWGGRTRAVKAAEWIQSRPAPPTRIGRKLEIIHGKSSAPMTAKVRRLHIPHGLAFGSGEHATTFLLLRSLLEQDDWCGKAVLDLGTGSGVLAMAARLLGTRKIVALDFDPEAVRTSRENEALNFPAPEITWRCADVKRLKAASRYDLVLANLFSGILAEAAPQIAASVAVGGLLWMSGILRTQQDEVTAAYLQQKLELVRAIRRGKWVMLQWRKPAA